MTDHRRAPRSPALLFIALSLASALLYLGASRAGGFLGFPLDDAWIHQTYARHLGERGEFAFVPGHPSAGSTSPLWSGLLAIGYLLRAPYLAWTYALGAALLALTAWLAYRFSLNLWPVRAWVGDPLQGAAVAAGAFVALEWHLGWAAVSGMEMLLFTALALAAFVIPPRRALWVGVCVGLSVLARPDGLTLLPFALARVVLSERTPAGRGHNPLRRLAAWERFVAWERFATATLCLLGFGMIFAPYLLFNHWLGGAFWPNTFYAKQAEYASHRALPLLARLVWLCNPAAGRCEPGLGLLPFVGAQALLLPGIAGALWESGKARRWEGIVAVGWAIAFIAAYTLRLPVTYQHGRYVMPVIPVIIVIGVGGMAGWLRLRAEAMWPRVLSRVWLAAVVAALAAFCGLGAQAYTRDVQIIESEMVAAAKWVSRNTPADALIAAHDIGALGYFGGRNILDMAGLVSPEVIPFIRDEDALRRWLTDSDADYLMTFPDWYPGLVAPLAGSEVFNTHAPYSPEAGGANMAVYRWPPEP
jgi:hypothetical protein